MTDLPLTERGARRKSSVDKLNLSELYAYGYEFLLSEIRRASDPGPELRQPWIPTTFLQDATVSWKSLPPEAQQLDTNSSSSSSSRSLRRLSTSLSHQQQGCKSCPNCLDLLKCLKKRYRGAETHTEKILLLTTTPEHLVPDETIMEEFGCSRTLAYTAITLRRNFGSFFSCPPQFIQHMPNFVKTSILEFFTEPDNSGEMKGSHGGGGGIGGFDIKRFHKRAMFVSLSELFQEYIFIYPFNRRTVTYSRFANLIPSHVIWSKPFYGNSQEETCIIHENFQLILSSCYHFYSEGTSRVLNEIVCSSTSPICMLGYCERCPIPRKLAQLTGDYGMEEKVEFYTWQSMDSTTDSSRDKDWRKPVAFLMITEPLPVFDKRLSAVIREILRHHFIATEQAQHWQKLNRRLAHDRNLALVKMDFCEKFTCVSKVGPKSSKLISYDPQREIALYPFHVKYFDDEQNKVGERNFVVVSNDLRENATTAFLFRMELIQWMKRHLPHIKSVIYWSDDNAKNFKNAESIINLMFHEEDFRMKAKHEFTVEGHGAQECAEVVTIIKRICRRACIKGEVAITDAEEMWKYCTKELAVDGGLEFGYLDRRLGRIKNVEMRLERRYQVNNGIIPGVDHFYSFRPDYSGIRGHEDNIRVRRLSASEEYQVIRVKLKWAGRHDDEDDFLWHSVVSHRYAVDGRRLQVGNIVTFSVEGIFFAGRICGDQDVMKGKLQVMMIGHVEKVKGGRRIGQVNFDQGKMVEISSLDVVLVENADSVPGSSWRGAGVSGGGWGGGTRKLLSGFGRRMLGGGSFKL